MEQTEGILRCAVQCSFWKAEVVATWRGGDSQCVRKKVRYISTPPSPAPSVQIDFNFYFMVVFDGYGGDIGGELQL